MLCQLLHRGLSFLWILMLLWGCQQKHSQENTASNEGEQLAKQYCASCHVFPEPSLLPKNIWLQKVLPNMATRLGIQRGYAYYKLEPDDMQAVINAHIIPEQPVLPVEDMMKIVKYYEKNAPEKPIVQQRTIESTPDLKLFSVKKGDSQLKSTQNVLIKPFESEQKILFGFEDKGAFVYDIQTKKYQPVIKGIATDACVWNNKLYLLDLISVQAHNLPKDKIWDLGWQNGQVVGTPKNLNINLIRPVSMDVADINKDQKPDFVVAEFGDYLGKLSLYLSSEKGFQELVLKLNPGASKVYFRDMNNDGLLDVVALMSQGKEEVCIFLSQGDDKFTEKKIIEFPPSYGSNIMRLVDFNHDGLLDILMTNGDNADMSSSLKAYHGVRLLINSANLAFKQKWFYPVHGASDVVAADFDQDGDEDLAIIAHFPDFEQKNDENFVYFRNDGNFKLTPMKFSKPLNGGLLTLAKMDVDKDGDIDLLVGNYLDFLTNPSNDLVEQWGEEKNNWWILENTTKKKK